VFRRLSGRHVRRIACLENGSIEVAQVPLDSVVARLAYLGQTNGRVSYKIYPPSSGREAVSPPKKYHDVPIYNCRPVASQFDLDREGFIFVVHSCELGDFLSEPFVRERYYPHTEALLQKATGALEVIAFDHNVRSSVGAQKGQAGIRQPVDSVHDDYTHSSGKKRVRELLEARGHMHLLQHRTALINVWRPIRGPVQDVPLAVCDAQSASLEDFVDTDIDHFAENDLSRPSHSGEIYSVHYNPKHRWYYAPDMQPDEAWVFKGYDSLRTVARFTPHTGFNNPDRPVQFLPRESIEVRTIVIYPT
jgi:hypothetical protein